MLDKKLQYPTITDSDSTIGTAESVSSAHIRKHCNHETTVQLEKVLLDPIFILKLTKLTSTLDRIFKGETS